MDNAIERPTIPVPAPAKGARVPLRNQLWYAKKIVDSNPSPQARALARQLMAVLESQLETSERPTLLPSKP